ncbi:T9SS type A sorting domain-containing protein [bacterium]|nr:T9SS type A sorting domain-containing protein [bacterium]
MAMRILFLAIALSCLSGAMDAQPRGSRLNRTPLTVPLENVSSRYVVDDHTEMLGEAMQLKSGAVRDSLGNAWVELHSGRNDCPMCGWYRYAVDGLHMLKDSAGSTVDRLWLPLECSVGEIFESGMIVDTGSVHCGVTRRSTVTIDYGADGVWRWADQLGAVQVDQGNRTFRFMESTSCFAPLRIFQEQEFTPPFGDEDLLVFRRRTTHWFTTDWHNYFLKTLKRGQNIRGSWHSGYLLLPKRYRIPYDGVRVSLNERNVLTWYEVYENDSLELYPAFIPTRDEILLNDVAWTVARRFDTLVLGADCRAYELVRGPHSRIITDRFGEIRAFTGSESVDAGECYLTSAVVRDTSFNRDSSRYRYFDLCEGDRMQFKRTFEWSESIDWWEFAADSIISGDTWFLLPQTRLGIFGRPLSGWLRWAEDGLHSYDTQGGADNLILRSDASLGDWCEWGIVYDTSTVIDAGVHRRLLKAAADIGYSTEGAPGWTVYLLAGVGMQLAEWVGWEYKSRFELLYAENCGETWGDLVEIDTELLQPSSLELSVYPNPIPLSQQDVVIVGDGFQAGMAQLCVTDMLGREIQTASISLVGSSVRHQITLNNTSPGLYMVTLHQSSRALHTKLLVY